MLQRAMVTALLVFSLGAPQARAADPVTVGGVVVAVGAAALTLKFCRDFLRNMREEVSLDGFPSPEIPSPVLLKPEETMRARIEALELPDDQVTLNIVHEREELLVVPEFIGDSPLPARLKLSLTAGPNYFVSFQDIYFRKKAAVDFVEDLERDLKAKGYNPELELALAVSIKNEFVITVTGVSSAQEWTDVYLRILHAVALRYFAEGRG